MYVFAHVCVFVFLGLIVVELLINTSMHNLVSLVVYLLFPLTNYVFL